MHRQPSVCFNHSKHLINEQCTELDDAGAAWHHLYCRTLTLSTARTDHNPDHQVPPHDLDLPFTAGVVLVCMMIYIGHVPRVWYVPHRSCTAPQNGRIEDLDDLEYNRSWSIWSTCPTCDLDRGLSDLSVRREHLSQAEKRPKKSHCRYLRVTKRFHYHGSTRY